MQPLPRAGYLLKPSGTLTYPVSIATSGVSKLRPFSQSHRPHTGRYLYCGHGLACTVLAKQQADRGKTLKP